jgi:hypothetical protein
MLISREKGRAAKLAATLAVVVDSVTRNATQFQPFHAAAAAAVLLYYRP